MDEAEPRAECAPLDSSADISVCYAQCLASFMRLLTFLNHPSSPTSDSEESCISIVLEEYGRLRTWGEETRAALPAASRGSLDVTLRKNDTLKSTVARILAKIQRQVEHAIRTMQTAQDGAYDSLRSDLAPSLDTEESSESSSGKFLAAFVTIYLVSGFRMQFLQALLKKQRVRLH